MRHFKNMRKKRGKTIHPYVDIVQKKFLHGNYPIFTKDNSNQNDPFQKQILASS